MATGLRRLIRRIVPMRLRNARIRARALLLQEQPLVEIQCRQDFFNHAFRALSYNGIGGDYVEFGCHSGLTFALAHSAARRHSHEARLWAFDSFCGLPPPNGEKDSHPHWKEGSMATSAEEFHKICRANGIPRGEYEIVPGFYGETLAKMPPQAAPTNICLAYIDCDLYSSARSVLQFLMPRLKHGMILASDDYYCWSATEMAGERRAMLEFFENNDRWRLLPYIQYGWAGASFVIERISA